MRLSMTQAKICDVHACTPSTRTAYVSVLPFDVAGDHVTRMETSLRTWTSGADTFRGAATGVRMLADDDATDPA